MCCARRAMAASSFCTMEADRPRFWWKSSARLSANCGHAGLSLRGWIGCQPPAGERPCAIARYDATRMRTRKREEREGGREEARKSTGFIVLFAACFALLIDIPA